MEIIYFDVTNIVVLLYVLCLSTADELPICQIFAEKMSLDNEH